MPIVLPPQCMEAQEKCRSLGVLDVSGQNPPPSGHGYFSGLSPWVLSNWDRSGIYIGGNWATIVADDTLQVITPTGSQQVTVVSNDGDPNGNHTTLTIVQDSFDGVLEDGQSTGVWKCT